jgi:hypothetical protein
MFAERLRFADEPRLIEEKVCAQTAFAGRILRHWSWQL